MNRFNALNGLMYFRVEIPNPRMPINLEVAECISNQWNFNDLVKTTIVVGNETAINDKWSMKITASDAGLTEVLQANIQNLSLQLIQDNELMIRNCVFYGEYRAGPNGPLLGRTCIQLIDHN